MSLDSEVRRADEDRWLASRFAPADVRQRLIALYAFNHEVARTPETVTQPALGAIRLAWWREALEEIYGGGTQRAHPVVEALARERVHFTLGGLIALIDARERDLDAAPFATWDEMDAYIDATAGQLMRLAVTACGAEPELNLIAAASQAWGHVGLTRARRAAPGGPAEQIERAKSAYARVHSRVVPAAWFPALGYVALVPAYLRSLEQGQRGRPLFLRQLALIAASATGRL